MGKLQVYKYITGQIFGTFFNQSTVSKQILEIFNIKYCSRTRHEMDHFMF